MNEETDIYYQVQSRIGNTHEWYDHLKTWSEQKAIDEIRDHLSYYFECRILKVTTTKEVIE